MALTAKERSEKQYKQRRENGLCPRCGKKMDREGFYCSECLEKHLEYRRENKEFYRKNHLCTICGKIRVYGSDKTCFECRAKKNKYKKNITQEQMEKRNKKSKKKYKERSEQGICTRCGKRKAMSGRKKCGICLAKDAELHRKRYFNQQRKREYKKENHLCYQCGKPIDLEKGQLCSECLEKCRQNGKKNGGKNKYWVQDNRLIFKR